MHRSVANSEHFPYWGAEDARKVFAQFLLVQPQLPHGMTRQFNSQRASPVLPHRMKTSEDEARDAWQDMLDALAKATSEMNKASQKAAEIAALDAQCSAGDKEACETLSNEESAKKAWLAKSDQKQQWGSGLSTKSDSPAQVSADTYSSPAPAQVSADTYEASAVASFSEEETKRAWLEKLDIPAERAKQAWIAEQDEKRRRQRQRWVGSSPEKPRPTTASSSSVDSFSELEESKRSWLSKLDVSEEDAKAAWIAAQDEKKKRRWGSSTETTPTNTPRSVGSFSEERAWRPSTNTPRPVSEQPARSTQSQDVASDVEAARAAWDAQRKTRRWR